jgi:hypothetical protein
MEETRRPAGKETAYRSAQADTAAQRAEAFLDGRDAADWQAGSGGTQLPFHRNPEAARASTEAIMASVHVLGVPDAGTTARRLPFLAGIRGKRVYRIASLAAAAVMIAALSSILTFNVLRVNATVDVRFVLVAPDAASVHLAADFNQWSPEGYDLVQQSDGTWEITVPLRKGRAYAYNFIIDGERWIADPSSSSLLDDGFGGASSSMSL